jgi:PTH2 family peptidyl-tRNA hydrolase
MADNKQIVMYILVNVDLKMKPGKIAAQVGHVVGVIVEEIIKKAYDDRTPESLEDYDYYEKWTKNNMYKKVTLKAREEELRDFLKNEKKCRYIIDAGLTQIAPNSLTVVGFFPRDDLAEKFKHLKLL